MQPITYKELQHRLIDLLSKTTDESKETHTFYIEDILDPSDVIEVAITHGVIYSKNDIKENKCELNFTNT